MQACEEMDDLSVANRISILDLFNPAGEDDVLKSVCVQSLVSLIVDASVGDGTEEGEEE